MHLITFLPWISRSSHIRGVERTKGNLKMLVITSSNTSLKSIFRIKCFPLLACVRACAWLTVDSEEEAVPRQVFWNILGAALDSGWWENDCLERPVWRWPFQRWKEPRWQEIISPDISLFSSSVLWKTVNKPFGCSGWELLFGFLCAESHFFIAGWLVGW